MISFASPAALFLLLLLPLLVTGAVIASRLRGKRWGEFVATRLRPRLLRRSSPLPRWIAFSCLLLGLALLIIALARPQNLRGTRTEMIIGRNILIALDLSRSMKVADIQPDRLTQAKATCYELLDALPNDRIGLLGFSGSPYLFAPLTVDHSAIRETIAEIDIDWIPTGGSNLAGGMEEAIATLKKTGTRHNALILMTDGEEHIGRIADLADQARAAGIQVITIGFGTTNGDFVPDPGSPDGRFRDNQGREVISRLETAPLEKIAAVTGGRFAIASSGADIPAMVETAVADLDQAELGDREMTVVSDFYQWFLLPGILLLMISVVVSTRWRGLPTTAALAFLLALAPRPAQAVSLGEADRALAEDRFEDARDAYGALAERNPDSASSLRLRLGQGTAAYRAGDFATARRAFSEALRSKDPQVRAAAHHGLGNTLFEIGWARLTDGQRYPSVPPPEEENPDADADEEADPFDRLSDAIIGPPDPDAKGDLADFEALVKQRLAEWMAEEGEPDSASEGSRVFDELLTDWVDAVKHHDNAGTAEATHNRELTMTHLRKILEILKQVEENAQQIQAIPMAGEGEGQQQEGESGEGEGEGQPGGNGGQGKEPREQQEGGDEGQEPRDGSGEREGEPQAAEDGKETKGPRPGESPEDAARRILNENADLQKGALNPGRAIFRRPEKDW
ncbi:MAG: VWA domain-containing protein [Akkermansiaceae bacterium]|nr:VWA domain-containing protein [Akkermansiaceae bacterium]